MRCRRTLPASLREDLVAIVELSDAKVAALRDQDDLAVEIDQLFLTHVTSGTLGYHYLGAKKSV